MLDFLRGNGLGVRFIDGITDGLKRPTAERNAYNLETLLAKAEDWGKQSRARFEKSKYMLVHIT